MQRRRFIPSSNTGSQPDVSCVRMDYIKSICPRHLPSKTAPGSRLLPARSRHLQKNTSSVVTGPRRRKKAATMVLGHRVPSRHFSAPSPKLRGCDDARYEGELHCIVDDDARRSSRARYASEARGHQVLDVDAQLRALVLGHDNIHEFHCLSFPSSVETVSWALRIEFTTTNVRHFLRSRRL